MPAWGASPAASGVPAMTLCGSNAAHPFPTDFYDVIGSFAPPSVRVQYPKDPSTELVSSVEKWLGGQLFPADRLCAQCHGRYRNAVKQRNSRPFEIDSDEVGDAGDSDGNDVGEGGFFARLLQAVVSAPVASPAAAASVGVTGLDALAHAAEGGGHAVPLLPAPVWGPRKRSVAMMESAQAALDGCDASSPVAPSRKKRRTGPPSSEAPAGGQPAPTSVVNSGGGSGGDSGGNLLATVRKSLSHITSSPAAPLPSSSTVTDVYSGCVVPASARKSLPKRAAEASLARHLLVFGSSDDPELAAVDPRLHVSSQQLRHALDPLFEYSFANMPALAKLPQAVTCKCPPAAQEPLLAWMEPRRWAVRICLKCLAAGDATSRSTPLQPDAMHTALRLAIASGKSWEFVGRLFPFMGAGEPCSERTYWRALRVLKGPVEELLDRYVARARAEYSAYINTLSEHERKTTVYVSFDGSWDKAKAGHHCIVTAIAIGVPGLSCLLGYEYASRATASDPEASRCGRGGERGASAKQLEALAMERLVTSLKVADVKVPVACVDGDLNIQRIVRETLGATLVFCNNHSAKGIAALFKPWSPGSMTKTTIESETTGLRHASGLRSARSVPLAPAEAERLLHDTARGILAEHGVPAAAAVAAAEAAAPAAGQDAAGSGAGAGAAAAQRSASGTSRSRATRRGASAAPPPDESESESSDDDEGDDDIRALDAEEAGADSPWVQHASREETVRRAQEFGPLGPLSLAAAIGEVAAAVTDFSVPAMIYGAVQRARAMVSTALQGAGCAARQSADGADEGDDNGDNSTGHDSFFSGIGLDTRVTLLDDDDDDDDGDDDDGGDEAGTEGPAGSASAAAPTSDASAGNASAERPQCACKGACKRSCACKSGGVPCARPPEGQCTCRKAACTNTAGGLDADDVAVAAKRAYDKRVAGVYEPLISLDELRAHLATLKALRKGPAGSSGGAAAAAAAAAVPAATAVDDGDDDGDGDDDRAGDGAGGDEPLGKRGWLAGHVKPRKLPESMHMAKRLLSHHYSVITDASVLTAQNFEERMLLAMRHWCNDHPDAHVHCSSGCYLRKVHPDIYKGPPDEAAESGAAADDAAAPNIPDGLRASLAALDASTAFRVIRDKGFISFLLGIIIVLTERFNPDAPRRTTTNHNEALNSRIHNSGPPKTRLYRHHWKLWADMQLLTYLVGSGTWREELCDILHLPVCPGTRLFFRRASAADLDRRTSRSLPAVRKLRTEKKNATRDFAATLNKPNVPLYERRCVLNDQLAEMFPAVTEVATPEEAAILSYLGKMLAGSQLREEHTEQLRAARKEKRDARTTAAPAAAPPAQSGGKRRQRRATEEEE